MGREAKTPAAPKKVAAPRTPVTPEDGIAPLFAIHSIIYGNGQKALPKSMFVPISEVERNELLKEAARELTEDELRIFTAAAAQGEPATENETPVGDADGAAATTTDSTAASGSTSDTDVIG